MVSNLNFRLFSPQTKLLKSKRFLKLKLALIFIRFETIRINKAYIFFLNEFKKCTQSIYLKFFNEISNLVLKLSWMCNFYNLILLE